MKSLLDVVITSLGLLKRSTRSLLACARERLIFCNLTIHVLTLNCVRALTERKVEGMSDLDFLDFEDFKKPLGPGYKMG